MLALPRGNKGSISMRQFTTITIKTISVFATGILLLAMAAQAAPPAKQLTLNVQGSGTVTLDPPGGSYSRGTVVVMTATADAAWNFDHWEGGSVQGSTANPQSITMNKSQNITAVFAQPPGNNTVRSTDVVIRVVDAGGQPVPNVDVQVDMTEIDFGFGTAVSASALANPEYANWLKSNYNWAVPENASKWPQNEPVQGQVSYANPDAIYNFAAANGIRMRGHTVFWAVQSLNQQWLQDLPYPAGLQAAVDARMDSVIPHFADKYEHWDINNEMLHGSFFADRLGASIRPYMFNRVKALDPDVQVFVNDYNIIAGGSELNAYVTQINELLAAGTQIDGIGVQGHFSGNDSMAQITQRLDTLAAFGLPIWVTEYDYADSDPVARADYLEDFYRTAFAHPAVQGILMWGYWANAHWRGADAALLDADFTVNAAGQRYQALRAEWWTNTAGTSNGAGEVAYNGYYGDYVLTVSDGVNPPETFDISMPTGTDTPTYVLTLGTGTPSDVFPPNPNPATWAAVPTAVSDDAIAMTATTATDDNAVEYYFSNLDDSGHDSGWQDSPEYVDAGLAAASNYSYTVVARDKSIAQNTTAASAQASATTDPDDGNLVINGGFEYGTAANWISLNGGALEAQTGTVRSGNYAGRISARSQPYDGLLQDLTSVGVNGSTWQCSGWVQIENAASAPVGMTVRVNDGNGDSYFGLQWSTATNTGWTQLSGTLTLSYVGTLNALQLYFEGPDPGISYFLDDVVCTSDAPPAQEMYVADIAMSYKSKGPNNNAVAVVQVFNESGAPLAGASVAGTWSGAVNGSATATTSSDGRVTFNSPKSRNSGAFTFSVDSVTFTGYNYNAALNAETSDTVIVP